MRHVSKGEEYFQIHEVYYNKAGQHHSYTKDPIDPIGDDLEALRWVLTKMLECLDKPVLTEADFRRNDDTTRAAPIVK